MRLVGESSSSLQREAVHGDQATHRSGPSCSRMPAIVAVTLFASAPVGHTWWGRQHLPRPLKVPPPRHWKRATADYGAIAGPPVMNAITCKMPWSAWECWPPGCRPPSDMQEGWRRPYSPVVAPVATGEGPCGGVSGAGCRKPPFLSPRTHRSSVRPPKSRRLCSKGHKVDGVSTTGTRPFTGCPSVYDTLTFRIVLSGGWLHGQQQPSPSCQGQLSSRSLFLDLFGQGNIAGRSPGEPIGTAALPPASFRLSPIANVSWTLIIEASMRQSVEATQAHLQHNSARRPCQPFLPRKALVEYYGAETPLRSLATLSTPDSARPSRSSRSIGFDGA